MFTKPAAAAEPAPDAENVYSGGTPAHEGGGKGARLDFPSPLSPSAWHFHTNLGDLARSPSLYSPGSRVPSGLKKRSAHSIIGTPKGGLSAASVTIRLCATSGSAVDGVIHDAARDAEVSNSVILRGAWAGGDARLQPPRTGVPQRSHKNFIRSDP